MTSTSMTKIVWEPIIHEIRLIHKEARAAEFKIKRFLQNKNTNVCTVHESLQAKKFVELARQTLGRIEKVKQQEKEVFKLLIQASTSLHTAIIHTYVVDGTIHHMLCHLFERVFNLLPIGCAFQGEIF